MGLSITSAHGAAVGLPKGHICLKIKLYLSRLLPFPVHRSCQLKPCLGEHVARSKLINRLSVSLCPFWIVHIENSLLRRKKKTHKTPPKLPASLSFSSSFVSAFPSMVTAIPLVYGHIFGVQKTLSIHLQIATKSDSDSCT